MVVTKEAPMPSGTAGARSCANSLTVDLGGQADRPRRAPSRSAGRLDHPRRRHAIVRRIRWSSPARCRRWRALTVAAIQSRRCAERIPLRRAVGVGCVAQQREIGDPPGRQADDQRKGDAARGARAQPRPRAPAAKVATSPERWFQPSEAMKIGRGAAEYSSAASGDPVITTAKSRAETQARADADNQEACVRPAVPLLAGLPARQGERLSPQQAGRNLTAGRLMVQLEDASRRCQAPPETGSPAQRMT